MLLRIIQYSIYAEFVTVTFTHNEHYIYSTMYYTILFYDVRDAIPLPPEKGQDEGAPLSWSRGSTCWRVTVGVPTV